MRACFSSIEIGPYKPDVEFEGAYTLWERNFGRQWPITLGIFREVTEAVHSRVETYQLAARDQTGRLIGYLGSQLRPRKDTEASLLLLMVDPQCQRQGIGTKLLQAALEKFENEKIATIHLGANAALPFWPGIPSGLPVARAFFAKHGWQFYEESYDLMMDLREFAPPDWVSERPRQHGMDIRPAALEDVPALYRYLEAEFPAWRRWFVHELEVRGPKGIVVAGKGSQVVGALLLSDSSSPDWTGRQWRTFLGEDMGALGTVCVRESERNQGIGLAMVALASQILRDRGVRNCFVHWTWLVDWYGKLGYKVWQEYWMAKKVMRES